jgi:hypothetical protein
MLQPASVDPESHPATRWTRIATANSLDFGGRPTDGFRSVRRPHRGQFDGLAARHERSPAELTGMHPRVQGPQTRPRCKYLPTRLHEAVDNARCPGWGPTALAVLSTDEEVLHNRVMPTITARRPIGRSSRRFGRLYLAFACGLVV